MSDSQSSSSGSPSSVAIDQNVGRSLRSSSGGQTLATDVPRRWHDIFWLALFIVHLMGVGFALTA
ncbi:hypothetical protein Tsubulata_045111, partial [Turnera subulata]